MAKYLDKSKEKWDELVDQWHSDSSLTCSLQEYNEIVNSAMNHPVGCSQAHETGERDNC